MIKRTLVLCVSSNYGNELDGRVNYTKVCVFDHQFAFHVENTTVSLIVEGGFTGYQEE